MKIFENISLKKYNTFNIESIAPKMIMLENESDLLLLKSEINGSRFYILGGGSNVLFSENFSGVIVYNNIKGIKLLNETEDSVLIEVNSGEEWQDFVKFTVEKNYFGLENLALIPGKCGAAPVQNIGAYGIEQEMLFVKLKGYDLTENKFKEYHNKDCNFGYRNSIFKNQLKNNFIITSIQYKLNKKFIPNIEYRDLAERFKGKNPTQKDIFNAVCDIRNQKLPNPEIMGNAGSFFKNPVISESKYFELINRFSDITGHIQNNGKYKISAAKLIEMTGNKGKRYRNTDAGVYKKHSLILVNYGNASGKDVYNLSAKIISEVDEKFGIKLEREVNVI